MKDRYRLQLKWGTSRGRDTYGYTICSLYVDGQKVASCNGGGYDMRGAVLGDWIAREFQTELVTLLAPKACRTVYTDEKGKWLGDQAFHKGRDFYGLTAAYCRETASYVRASLDGACGWESMRKILNAIGLDVTYLWEDAYLVEKLPASAEVAS
jgi:hypothetical protein